MGERRTTDLGRGATLIAALIVLGCSSGTPGGTATARPGTQTDAPTTTAPQQPTEAAEQTAEATAAVTSAPTSTQSPAAQPTGAGPAGPAIPSDVALFGTGLVPDGWQVVEDATGACRFAAPPDWTTDMGQGTAQAGIAEALAGVSATTEDWESYKDTVDQLYLTGHVTLIDTDELFLIANPPTSDLDLSYVLVLRRDEVNCHLLMTVRRNAIAEHGADAILIGQTLDRAD